MMDENTMTTANTKDESGRKHDPVNAGPLPGMSGAFDTHIDDALAVIELARAGKWHWCENSRCKYIDLHIDMRDGGCVIRDRDGNRIDASELRKQLDGHMHGYPWPASRSEIGGWQLEAVKRVGA